MKTSAIRHPENSYFIRRCDWQVKMLADLEATTANNKAECAAEILSVMEYHFNNPTANRKLRQLIDANHDHGLAALGDWTPYSVKYLEELLLHGRGGVLIKAALEHLIDRGYVSTDVPADILEKFPVNARYYKLEVDKINEWIDENWQKSWLREKAKRAEPKNKGGRPPKAKDDAMLETLFDYYKHVHAKNANFVIDRKRRDTVKKRIKEDKRPAGQCAMAIIGNLKSDYHQGRQGDQPKIFDDIELIFRNAKTFESHLGYAENAGITEEMALDDLEAFVVTGASQYAKKPVKSRQTAPNEQTGTFRAEPVNASRYKELAYSIASFFHSGTENVDILSFCVDNAKLVEIGKGVIDQEFLAEKIIESLKVFRPEGVPDDMRQKIGYFAGTYCKQQQLNLGG